MAKSLGTKTILRHIFVDGVYKRTLSLQTEVFMTPYTIKAHYIDTDGDQQPLKLNSHGQFYCRVEA